MKLESYKQLSRVVTFSIGLIVAIGVALNNLILPLVGITGGMLVLYSTKQRVKEIERDERTAFITQRASQATLSVTIIVVSFLGLGLMLLSRAGILDYEQLGFYLALLGLLIMSLRAFFDWYYKNRLGG